MKNNIIIFLMLATLSGCGKFAPATPLEDDEPLTAAEEAAIAEEEQVWLNRPTFDVTIAEFETKITEYDIFKELSLVTNSTVYLTRNKLIEIDYKAEGQADNEKIGDVMIFLDIRSKTVEESEEQLSDVMEMIIGSLGEVYVESQFLSRLLDNEYTRGEMSKEQLDISYSKKMNLEIGYSKNEVQIILSPVEKLSEDEQD